MMIEMDIPGSSIAIIDDGQLVYYSENGFANTEEETPVNAQTIFEGASMSKPAFAFMVMSLAEAGRLDLDQPVHEYFDYRPFGTREGAAWYEKLTPRMLLSHTTGLPNWREADTLSVAFEPGTRFSYSGEGYILLERAVQEALGTDYRGLEAYFQSHVAAPLGMTSTKFVQDSASIGRTATPYRLAPPSSP